MTRALLAVLLALALPAIAEGPAPAPVPAPAHSAPFLYEIAGPKAKHFLLGSVHVLPASAHPLPAALDAAYEATRALTIEADLAALAAPELQGRMLGAAREHGDGGLQARIGKSLYARLQKHAARLGMPTPVCEQFQAWFCALALELFPLQQAGFAAEFGIDHHFYARATDDARPISGLETAQFQVELFTGMSPALSKQLLAATLEEGTYTSQSPQELYRIWRSGDLAALDKVLKDLRQRYPELNALLLGNRNRAWMPGLLERFRSETPQLVVVGAAHLPGSDGLLALLKAQGIEAKPAAGVIELAKPRAGSL